MSVRVFLTGISIWILGLEARYALNSVAASTNPMMAGREQKSKGRVNSLDTGHPSSLAPGLWSACFLHLQTLWLTLQPPGSHVFELDLICITCFPGSPACRRGTSWPPRLLETLPLINIFLYPSPYLYLSFFLPSFFLFFFVGFISPESPNTSTTLHFAEKENQTSFS